MKSWLFSVSTTLAFLVSQSGEAAVGKPVFGGVTPPSPSDVARPMIRGRAPFDATTVKIYNNNNCSLRIGMGTKAEFEGRGIKIFLRPGTTTLYARAFDASGAGSGCARLTTYQQTGTSSDSVNDKKLRFGLTGGYGGGFMMFSQKSDTNTLGGGDTSSFALNHLLARGFLEFGKWNAELYYGGYSLRVVPVVASIEQPAIPQKLSALGLRAGYSHFFLGFEQRITPITFVRATTADPANPLNSVDWADLKTIALQLGARFNGRGEGSLPWLYSIDFAFYLTMSGSSSTPTVLINKASGVGFELRPTLKKLLTRSFGIGAELPLTYVQHGFNGTWNGIAGDGKRSLIEARPALILSYDF